MRRRTRGPHDPRRTITMPLDRRRFLGRTAATGAGAALAGAVAAPAGAREDGRGRGRAPKRYSFSVLGTTDLHGNVFNWDYFTDAEYDDKGRNDIGLAKVSTLVNRVREEKGRGNTLLVDAGDTIQGTQLSYYYAKVDPITGENGPVHPMAQAMNAIGYDAAALVAERVPGIDAILVGHAHAEIAERRVVNTSTGREVVLSEPLKWGQRLTVFDFELVWDRGRWQVESVSAKVLNSNAVEEDPAITGLLGDEHAKVVSYVNQVIGTSARAMSAAEAPYRDTPVIDFINFVQAETVREALAGTEHAGCRCCRRRRASPGRRRSRRAR
jgi:2',3'-cyclic-nucleotide 2'-phosphodiesterase (5'-nucleotidase family)